MIIQGKYAASNFYYKQGIIIDLAEKTFRKVSSAFGLFRFNDTLRKLPPIDYVLMFKTFYVKCEACDLEEDSGSATYQVSLVYNKNRRLVVHEAKKAAEVKEIAMKMAQALNVRVRDSATNRRAPRWLNAGEMVV
jgi:hypothetical protein